MQPGEDPFHFMMEIDRLAADVLKLDDKPVTELGKCVIIVAGLSADYEIEVRMLENNPAGLESAETKRVVGNQYNRRLRQKHGSKALSAPRSTTTVDRGEKKRRPRNRIVGNFSTAQGKVAALRIAGARRRRSKNQESPRTRRAEVGGSATSVGVRSISRINTVACAEAWTTGLAIVTSKELKG